MKKIYCLIVLLIFTGCAPVNPKYMPTGKIDLNKNSYEKNDGKNRLFIMEEPAKWTNSWHTMNNYYVDNKFVTRLIYGMSYVYETTKNKIKLSLASTYGSNKKGSKIAMIDSNSLEDASYGGRDYNVNFSEKKNIYIITYTPYNNFNAGGSAIGVLLFDRKLKASQNEPFKFRKVSKNAWWKIHDDAEKKKFYLKNVKESDLIKAREIQGVK